jgi:hypothetical protein
MDMIFPAQANGKNQPAKKGFQLKGQGPLGNYSI